MVDSMAVFLKTRTLVQAKEMLWFLLPSPFRIMSRRAEATPKFLMYKSMSDLSDPIGKREEKREGWTSALIGFSRLDARHFNHVSLRSLPQSVSPSMPIHSLISLSSS